jgi:hypothetical protein
MAGGWFVVREEYCWLVAGGWFVVREKYCWLVADKPSEQGARTTDPKSTTLTLGFCFGCDWGTQKLESMCARTIERESVC